MKKAFKWLMVIIWMVVIFLFSNEPAVVSDEKSRFVIYIFKFIGLNLDSILGELSNFIVRKAGHITEYLILYLLLMNAFKEYCNTVKSMYISFAVLVCYASSDEIHQLFVPGRAGRVSDVIIDSVGGIIGIIGIYMIRLKDKTLGTK